MGRRTEEQQARDAAQARARRARRRVARSRPASVPIVPAFDCHEGGPPFVWFGSPPTTRELNLIGEVLVHGSLSDAARCTGTAYSTAKNRMAGLYKRLGASSLPNALYLLGWVDVPARYRRPHR